jgi:hypothetical protein
MSDPQLRSQEPPAAGGYEKSDLTVKSAAAIAIVLTAVVAAVLLLILWMLGFFAVRFPAPLAPVSPRSTAVRSGPQEPPLQVDAIRDLQGLRAAEDALATSYGWVNREAGTVRIPVARAMELLVERGLPAPPEAAPVPGAKAGRRRP